MGASEQGGADFSVDLPQQEDNEWVQKGGSCSEVTLAGPSHIQQTT